ncbi:pimeloyl-ACP methyl ester carboxylesterase [Desulfohalotomaculum tongense]|uniref:alpha/beta hydrolase n=1 Tax=Desulforadius tongensis TaxID=1216062 RepID=UPI00195D917D|nr:alpha/beta hydrolase [Desulforadius tongensis]MBM7854617.1 pimeloyl-ACP methyl ester carboxylesterase [Desulforadius tongensis]
MKSGHRKLLYVFIFFTVIVLLAVLGRKVVFNSPINPISKTKNISQRYEKLSLKDSSTYIVFLNGLGTRCNGTRYTNMGFEHIRKRLTSYGFHYNDNRFLLYSYTGGEIRAGNWFPNKYGPEDTGQPIEISVKHLNDLIDDFSAVHPDARFILVGHSLGGYVAYDFVSRYYTENSNRIEGVVTLNAPLIGSVYNVPDFILDALGQTGSIWGSTAVKRIVSENEFREEIKEFRKEVANRLQKKGIHIATFATEQDLIVNPCSAYLIDTNDKPVTEGDIISVSRLGKLPDSLFGHRQVLKVDLIADYIISILET